MLQCFGKKPLHITTEPRKETSVAVDGCVLNDELMPSSDEIERRFLEMVVSDLLWYDIY